VTQALLDTSVVHRIANLYVGDAIEERLIDGHLALCAPVVFEVCFSARNRPDLDEIRSDLAAFPKVRTHQATFDRALEVQAELARTGRHRAASMTDLLVAAIAEANDLAVLHYDADFDLIAEVTGQTVEWVVPRGLVD
jgi:predicted nucleic acid-binding protein